MPRWKKLYSERRLRALTVGSKMIKAYGRHEDRLNVGALIAITADDIAKVDPGRIYTAQEVGSWFAPC